MNLIDTNGVTHILKNKLLLREDYWLAPDVVEESELALMVHGGKIPLKVQLLAQHDLYDQGSYLNHYHIILNKYGGRSFYNMTGFGDVSILAAIHTLKGSSSRQSQLFGGAEPIVVYTDDAPLARRIGQEFNGGNVSVEPVASIT